MRSITVTPRLTPFLNLVCMELNPSLGSGVSSSFLRYLRASLSTTLTCVSPSSIHSASAESSACLMPMPLPFPEVVGVAQLPLAQSPS